MARNRPGSVYVLVARYESESDASAALASFRNQIAPGEEVMETVETSKGTFHSYSQRGRYLVVVLDAESEEAAGQLRVAALERLAEVPE